MDKQKYINDLYNEFTQSILNSVSNTLAFQTENFPKYVHNPKICNKLWFSPELANIKNKITELRYRSDLADSTAEIKILKTKYASKGRIYISLKLKSSTN